MRLNVKKIEQKNMQKEPVVVGIIVVVVVVLVISGVISMPFYKKNKLCIYICQVKYTFNDK